MDIKGFKRTAKCPHWNYSKCISWSCRPPFGKKRVKQCIYTLTHSLCHFTILPWPWYYKHNVLLVELHDHYKVTGCQWTHVNSSDFDSNSCSQLYRQTQTCCHALVKANREQGWRALLFRRGDQVVFRRAWEKTKEVRGRAAQWNSVNDCLNDPPPVLDVHSLPRNHPEIISPHRQHFYILFSKKHWMKDPLRTLYF